MKKLFVVYVGGSHEQSLIEVHDMRFVVGDTIEDTYDALRKSWWGKPKSLHLDAWGPLNYVDGHEIHINTTPPSQQNNKLYFVNLGGYDKNQFTELHHNVFVVAADTGEAKSKAKSSQYIAGWEVPHKDYQYDVEDIISIEDVLLKEKLYIHLIPTKTETPFDFTCKYVPIGNAPAGA